MNAPGKGMLKVVSILFIVFGAIGTVVSIIGVAGVMMLGSLTAQLGTELQGAMSSAAAQLGTTAAPDVSNALAQAGDLSAVAGAMTGLLTIAIIIGLVASLLELIIGIIGLKKCGDPAQAGFFVATGIILCIVQLITIVLTMISGGSFPVFSLIGFILPILYIVGGNQNKNIAQAPAA